jgi:hypothetical protein
MRVAVTSWGAADQPLAMRLSVCGLNIMMDRVGEIMLPIAAGAFHRSHIWGDLYDPVVADGSSRQ